MAAPPFYGQLVTVGQAVKVDPQDKAGSCKAFILKGPVTNSTTGVFLGDAAVTASTGYQLDAGEQILYERLSQQGAGTFYDMRPSDMYVWIVTAGDKLTWLAFQ